MSKSNPICSCIKNRRSVRQYKDQAVEPEKIDQILRAAMYSPSAHNKRDWQFIVVDDRAKIKKLSEVKKYAEHLANAPVVIAVCSPDSKYWIPDSSIVAEHIYLEASNQGLGTCWTHICGSTTWDGGNPEDFVQNVLDIPSHIRILCLMPIGYPAKEIHPHQETKFDQNKIHHNQW